MDNLGPLSLMYSWQALLCATACVGITRMVKTAIDLKMGKEKRKEKRWLNHFVLPMVPIMIGLLYGALVPLRPEVLIEYTAQHITSPWLTALAGGAWGAACGQFSTMLHQKLKDFLTAANPA